MWDPLFQGLWWAAEDGMEAALQGAGR